MIRLEQVKKNFDNKFVLDSISLNFKKGEIHGIVGDNGAGKTVLVNIMSGVYPPDKGNLYFSGNPVQFLHPGDAIRSGIITIHQETNIVGDLSIAENIFLGSASGNSRNRWLVNWKDMERESKNILAKIHYPLEPNRLANTLNLGQQQILKIARAIVQNPKVLIMDEPFTNLSSDEIETFIGIITYMQNSGVTIIYISHDIDDILRRCNSITVLRNGHAVTTINNREKTETNSIHELLQLGSDFRYPRVPANPGRKILEIYKLRTDKRVNSVTFTLRKGEIFGIMGELGSGKSGIARAILGLERIEGGKILLDGDPFHPKNPRYAFRNRIGYLPEDILQEWLHNDLSIPENLTLTNLHEVHSIMRLHREDELDAARRYIASLKIKTSRLEERVSHLSGGNKQKLAIAKLLFSDSRILILDEPTKHLDSSTQIEVYNLISRCAGEGMAIIFISSNKKELMGMCDRILLMQKGKSRYCIERNTPEHPNQNEANCWNTLDSPSSEQITLEKG